VNLTKPPKMMKVIALVLAIASSAVAFTPSMSPKASKVITKAGIPDGAFGATVEVGKKPFDPLGLAAWRDFDEMRACELKNGRVAMLASVGWVWPQMFGLFESDDVTTTDPIAAITQVAPEGWIQMFLLAGCFESLEYKHKMSGTDKPLWDPLDLMPKDPVKKAAKMESELKNGRLAMLSVAAYASAHFIPGSVPLLPSGFH